MKKIWFGFVGLVLLAGCASLSGNEPRTVSKLVIGDLGLVAPPARAFAIYPVGNAAYLGSGSGAEMLVGMTRDAIRRTMEGKGYVLVAVSAEPDFIMGFGLGMESKITDEDIFRKTGMVAGLSTEGINQSAFQKGSILVAMFRPGDKEPAWRTLAQGMADMKKADAARKEAIDALVADMLSPVPPAGKETH